MIDRKRVMALLNLATPIAQRINDNLEKDEDLRTLDTKAMVCATAMYSAAYAKQTGLDLADFITFCVAAYDKTELDAKEKPKEIVN